MPGALRILGTTVLAAAVAAPASAADIIQPGEEKLTVMLGAFLPAFRTKVEVDGEQNTGDRIDLNRDLGADRNDSGGWVGAEWRFAPRHRLGFTYSRFTLRGDRTIDRDLHIGDKVFPTGTEVESQLRLELIPITYSYSLIKQDNDELAVTAGIHWDRLSFSCGRLGFDRRTQRRQRGEQQREPAVAAIRAALRSPVQRALVGGCDARRLRAQVRRGQL